MARPGYTSIINITEDPYFFTWDGGHYGPISPNEVAEFETPIALHAVKRSRIIDDEAQLVGYKVEVFNASKHGGIAKIACPFVALGQCTSGPFDDQASLKHHMDIDHFGIPDEPSTEFKLEPVKAGTGKRGGK